MQKIDIDELLKTLKEKYNEDSKSEVRITTSSLINLLEDYMGTSIEIKEIVQKLDETLEIVKIQKVQLGNLDDEADALEEEKNSYASKIVSMGMEIVSRQEEVNTYKESNSNLRFKLKDSNLKISRLEENNKSLDRILKQKVSKHSLGTLYDIRH